MNTTDTAGSPVVRWLVIAAIAMVALLASYTYAIAANANKQAASSATGEYVAETGSPVDGLIAAVTEATDPASQSAGGAACACCGTGASAPSEPIAGSAEVSGDAQKITVDLSKGYYDPNEIRLKAGVPAEITFGQGSGCLAAVQSQDLGFYEDLTAGPVTVKLPALDAGTYGFACGMNMVFGSIVVE
jgi:hypothetical protein